MSRRNSSKKSLRNLKKIFWRNRSWNYWGEFIRKYLHNISEITSGISSEYGVYQCIVFGIPPGIQYEMLQKGLLETSQNFLSGLYQDFLMLFFLDIPIKNDLMIWRANFSRGRSRNTWWNLKTNSLKKSNKQFYIELIDEFLTGLLKKFLKKEIEWIAGGILEENPGEIQKKSM